MSFLLDTNICSFHLKRPAGLMHRFVQHSGQLYISTLVLAELYTWAYQRSDPRPLADRIEKELLADVGVLDFDSDCARRFGEVRGTLLVRGIAVSRIDLMIGCVALVHNISRWSHTTRPTIGTSPTCDSSIGSRRRRLGRVESAIDVAKASGLNRYGGRQEG